MTELSGLILGIMGILFTFEKPREVFLKIFGFKKKTEIMPEIAVLSRIRSCADLSTDLQKAQIDKNKSIAIKPIEIIGKKEYFSELEFDDYFKSFENYNVTWEGEVGTVSMVKDGQLVRVQIIFEKRMRGFFDIRITDFPNVKLFKSGDLAIVTGEIHSPDWPTFDLVNTRVLKWTRK